MAYMRRSCLSSPDLVVISTATGNSEIFSRMRMPTTDTFTRRDGQGATKAAVRACRNAIEFNSIPCIAEVVPGGRPNMKIKIKLGVPAEVLDKVAERKIGSPCLRPISRP